MVEAESQFESLRECLGVSVGLEKLSRKNSGFMARGNTGSESGVCLFFKTVEMKTRGIESRTQSREFIFTGTRD